MLLQRVLPGSTANDSDTLQWGNYVPTFLCRMTISCGSHCLIRVELKQKWWILNCLSHTKVDLDLSSSKWRFNAVLCWSTN